MGQVYKDGPIPQKLQTHIFPASSSEKFLLRSSLEEKTTQVTVLIGLIWVMCLLPAQSTVVKGGVKHFATVD